MKTTAKHFALFRRVAAVTAARLGLTEWEFRFGHEHRDGVLAWVVYDSQARLASLFLARNWGADPVTDPAVARSAKHEVLHVLLAEMSVLARRDASEFEVDKTEHAVLQRLMRLL